jgi:hypothetical protein
MKSNYSWRATFKNSAVAIAGENISSAVSVELIPSTEYLPRHVFSGLTFVRRFCRGFMHGMGGGMKEYLHCIVTKECRLYVLSSTGAVVITEPDYELYL